MLENISIKIFNIENWGNFEYFGAGKNGSKSKSDSEVFLISKILRDEKIFVVSIPILVKPPGVHFIPELFTGPVLPGSMNGLVDLSADQGVRGFLNWGAHKII